MLFHSIFFFIFLAFSLFIYYVAPKSLQWLVLFLTSGLFLFLGSATSFFVLLIETIVVFFAANFIASAKHVYYKKLVYIITQSFIIGTLVYFKYLSFLLGTVLTALGFNGEDIPETFSNIILPLGISFYTFQAISYIIEVNRGSIKPEQKFGYFSVYMSFFPKLLSGPIERPKSFLPQVANNFNFHASNLQVGAERFLWGVFKKLVIADRISILTTSVFSSWENQSGVTLLFALLLYCVQIYADFSGYTDMAIGIAKMFGYNLMENFKFPLYAKSITEFWRKWHISLSSWAKDYIYAPFTVRYRDYGIKSVYIGLFLTFLMIGIWHGPSLSFVMFGLLQGVAIIFELNTKKARKKLFQRLPVAFAAIITHLSVISFLVLSFVFFNFLDLKNAFGVIGKIFIDFGTLNMIDIYSLIYSIIGITILFIAEYFILKTPGKMVLTFRNSNLLSIFWLVFQVITILLIGVFDGGQFIYFAY